MMFQSMMSLICMLPKVASKRQRMSLLVFKPILLYNVVLESVMVLLISISIHSAFISERSTSLLGFFVLTFILKTSWFWAPFPATALPLAIVYRTGLPFTWLSTTHVTMTLQNKYQLVSSSFSKFSHMCLYLGPMWLAIYLHIYT